MYGRVRRVHGYDQQTSEFEFSQSVLTSVYDGLLQVIMDLLVKLATEQYSHNQFIFFTPQGIKELGEREHVQVFEMPKVRD